MQQVLVLLIQETILFLISYYSWSWKILISSLDMDT